MCSWCSSGWGHRQTTLKLSTKPEGAGNHTKNCCHRSCRVTIPSLRCFPSRVVSGGGRVPSILALVRHWHLGGGSSALSSMCLDAHS